MDYGFAIRDVQHRAHRHCKDRRDCADTLNEAIQRVYLFEAGSQVRLRAESCAVENGLGSPTK